MGIFGLKPRKEKTLPPRCDYCGRFISYKDIHEGLATFKMISCDSAYSSEAYEGCCKKCYVKHKK